ncbi:MAG: PD40 domain-containing protein [Caldilineaceae bacterium]|nr:PD40 domain-containing protein [Caldilineaceae bacterium]
MLLTPGIVARAATPISGPVVVRPGGAQLYSVPDGEVLATLPTSTVFTASGRTEDTQWVVGQTAGGSSGWLRVEQVIAVGIELLPVATEAVPTDGTPAVEIEEPEATPVPASAATVTGTVTSDDDRLNVRNGPGTTYVVVATALPGESYPVVGRSSDGAWLQIDRGSGETGWVSAAYMTIAGDVTLLPTVTASSPPPSADPADPTPTAATQSAAPSSAAISDLSGTLVIQSSPGGMLYGYALDSGALWPLRNGFDPALSPDGQTVTFVRDGGENGIYLVDIDGSNERLIFSGRARLSSPKWNPGGQWILFTRSDDAYHCYKLGPSCITLPSSPDGREMTIPGAEPTTRYWYNLARVDSNGSNYRDIASLTSARAADWNEAGIVYQSDAGLQITADTPDAENHLVIFDYLKPYYNDPDWQPQGGRIVYMGKEASHWELFAVNPDGSGKSALTRPATTVVDEIPSNVAPAWSPDGQHIVFLSNRTANGEAGSWRVWVMEADGSNPRPLPIDLEITYTFGGEQAVSWAR